MASTESPDSPPHFASTIIPSERLDFGSQIMRTDPMLPDVNGSDGKEGRSGDREGRPPRPAGMSLSKWWKISIGGSPASGRAVAADQKKRFPCHRPCSRQKWTERAVERRVNHSAAIPFICHRTDGQEAPLDLSMDAEKKPTSCLLRLLLWPSACLHSAVSGGGPLGGPDPVAGGGRVTRSDIDPGASSAGCVAAFLDCDGRWRAHRARIKCNASGTQRIQDAHPGRRIGRWGVT